MEKFSIFAIAFGLTLGLSPFMCKAIELAKKENLNIPVEFQEQLMANQKAINEHKQKIEQVYISNQEILNEVLALNNKPSGNWVLKLENNRWNLYEKTK